MSRGFSYKGVKVNSLGFPIIFDDKEHRYKKDNRKRKFYNISFHSNLKENANKNLLVMYDIPHEMKNERDWFRRQLKNFHFIMIQKSVWVGPSPLPKEFSDYVKRIGLKDKFKTFKLEKVYK